MTRDRCPSIRRLTDDAITLTASQIGSASAGSFLLRRT